MTIPFPKGSTTFVFHVRQIIYKRPKEKMGGVHAERVVALMADLEFVGDGTVREEPRNVVGVSFSIPTELAIPSANSCAGP